MQDDIPGGRDVTGLRVLHVVHKFHSGVGAAVAQYTRSLAEAEHHLISGTVEGEGDLAEWARFATAVRMSGAPAARIRAVHRRVAELRPDVVHGHSSLGGAFARLAVSRRGVPLVYTPHCYSFERRDVGRVARTAFRLAEALLAVNTTVFAACSERERQLSDWPTRSAPRVLVPNVAPERVSAPRTPAEVPLVVGGGRLSPQKDPGFFLACVHRIREQRRDVRALWLGDDDVTVGAGKWRDRLEAAGVEVSGWLPRAAVLDLLAAAHLYLHSARWEGFPLMVAEAAALGVPTLVRALPSFVGVPPELVLGSPEDVSAALACLEGGDATSANVAAWGRLLAHHTVADQHAALVEVYSLATARAPAHQ